jgi:hypothetical protein
MNLPDVGTGWPGPGSASQHLVMLFLPHYLFGCILYVFLLKMFSNYHIAEGVLFISFPSMADWSYRKPGFAGTFHDSHWAQGSDKRDTEMWIWMAIQIYCYPVHCHFFKFCLLLLLHVALACRIYLWQNRLVTMGTHPKLQLLWPWP